jgi:hypothetical protein
MKLNELFELIVTLMELTKRVCNAGITNTDFLMKLLFYKP